MKRRALVLTVAALLAAVTYQQALATVITPTYSKLWGQNQEVPFRWKEDGVPPGWMKNAVTGAAADSKRSRGAQAPTFVQRNSADSWMTYSAELPASTALAFAHRNAPTWFRIWMRVQGHRFDWGTLRWCQFYDSPPNGCFDAQTVMLHEFGHIHALQHSSVEPPHTVMQPISLAKPKQHYNARDYGPCDVAGLQIRYEALTPSTPISTCLSLATELALSASATTITSGTSATLTAALRIHPDVSYAKLAGDPLSVRKVLLQRRLPGATSWTTHGQMADGSTAGTYRLTVSPATTYEWRAIFAETASEGLRGSSSSPVKVIVYEECTKSPCPL